MSDSDTRHLVGVWNPACGTDVMESHITLLRERAAAFRNGGGDEDDVYVWWGKIRSSRRQSGLPHIADILSLEDELGDADGTATPFSLKELARIIGETQEIATVQRRRNQYLGVGCEGGLVRLAKVRVE